MELLLLTKLKYSNNDRMKMKLEDLGYNPIFENSRNEKHLDHFEVGRITLEHKERYIVKTLQGDFDAEITGTMRFNAQSREDFPAVGDWVALTTYDGGFAIIHTILPRFSTLQRQAVGQFGAIQIIATNIDYAFLVQAADRDFSINRLERYLTICNSSNVTPIIIITKTDLIDAQLLSEIENSIKSRLEAIPLIAVSNATKSGFEKINTLIEKGKTYCLLGSSGVGKSSLLNNLSGKEMMKTGEISESIKRGKHVTSHRELIILENGGILIDNPGMREVGIADTDGGLETTFEMIVRHSKNCRFRDCTHTNEKGCSVLEAFNAGEIDSESYENYLKMEREKAHFESTIEDKRKKEKAFGKMVNNYKKDINRKMNF